jgi:hypothetical protein
VKRSTRAPSSAGQGAVRAVVVDKLVKAGEKDSGYIWCGTPVNANHLADAHGLDRPTADWSFSGSLTSLLSVRSLIVTTIGT